MVKSTDGAAATCTAQVSQGPVAISLVSSADKANDVALRITGASWGVGNSKGFYSHYQVEITPGSTRIFRNARMVSGQWSYALPHQSWSVNFLSEIAHGTTFILHEFRGKVILTVDISGAENAIASFVDCSNAIWPAQ